MMAWLVEELMEGDLDDLVDGDTADAARAWLVEDMMSEDGF